MTDEQYQAIQDAFTTARQTARGTMREGLTPAERKAAYDVDDAACERFWTVLAAARTGITTAS